MKAIRFGMAVLVVLGLVLTCLLHVRVIPRLAQVRRAERGEVLRNNLVGLLHCIDLSGGFSRWVLGHRRCKDVYRAPNGMLVLPEARCDLSAFASNLVACAQKLDAPSVRMLYVQMPCKQSQDGRGIPASFGGDLSNENRETLLTLLRQAMRTVDLRPIVSATAEDVGANFIRTDHHWNFEGAFKAFRFLVPVLLSELGASEGIRLAPLDRANWTSVGLPRAGARFLGSSGKRTGIWFAGYDRLDYLVPKFPVDLRVSTVDRHGVSRQRQGDFAAALLNPQDMREPATYLEDYGYNVYLGDLARVEIVNDSAPVAKTVFLVKNSMSQPLLAWMATVFTRLVAIDPRYHNGTFCEDVRAARPDLIVNLFERCRPDYYR